MTFHDFNYIEIIGYSISYDKDKSIYIDMGYGISSIDHEFFKTQFPDTIVHQVSSPIEIHDIDDKMNISIDYSLIIIYFPDRKPDIDESYLISIIHEFHIVEKFIYNILIDNDIIDPEYIQIDIMKYKTIIDSYEGFIYSL
jgi:hypothetical protein